jgi:ABC-2 type transport system ATP-binding protein
MNLLDRPQTLIVEYSHGMKKKLSLAAALIHSPQMLFLDEPFEGVDAVASLTLRSLLQELTARGLTIFLTSHVLEIVERLCTHLAILNRGKIVVQGTLSDLQTASGTGSLEALFIRSVGAPPERASGLDWLSSPGSFPGSSDSGGRL